MTRARMWVLAALGAVAMALPAGAQNLGPFRQFLAVEPYYTRLQVYRGENQSTTGLDGFGGRLWINLAPFVGESWTLLSTSGIAGFVSYFPERQSNDTTVWHFGGQTDIFFANRPFFGALDPFISVGAGAFRVRTAGVSNTDFALSPAAGVRIPIPNRFQLRADVRDAIVFERRPGPGGAGEQKRTTHNLEIQGAIGITF